MAQMMGFAPQTIITTGTYPLAYIPEALGIGANLALESVDFIDKVCEFKEHANTMGMDIKIYRTLDPKPSSFKAQGAPIQTNISGMAWQIVRQIQSYATGYSVTYEAEHFNTVPNLLDGIVSQCYAANAKRANIHLTQLLEGAFEFETSWIKFPGDQPLFSENQLLLDNQTTANRLSDRALNPNTLIDMNMLASTTVDLSGIPSPTVGKAYVASPILAPQISAFLNSTHVPNSANNNVNILASGMYFGGIPIIENPYMTNYQNIFLMTSFSSIYGLQMHYDPNTIVMNDTANNLMIKNYYHVQYWAFVIGDYRNIIGVTATPTNI